MNRISPRWYLACALLFSGCRATEFYEYVEYQAPRDTDSQWLASDRLQDKNPMFLPELVHREPIEEWQVNLSDAVIALDIPMVLPDRESELLEVHPSYARAIKRAGSVLSRTGIVLPSVNLIDGKAKQFDDGLYARHRSSFFGRS